MIESEPNEKANMDKLMEFTHRRRDVSFTSISEFEEFIFKEEYDTDAIEYDIATESQSNIEIFNTAIWMHLNYYLHLSQCMSYPRI